jgi:hypothetical protein
MALGFLGYDFYGRIVEKAIYLRNRDKAKKRKRCSDYLDETNVLLELAPGEQLEESDIQRALDDINPTPLYSAAPEKKIEPQLYFGPGFEDRLEMEMEELLAGMKEKSLPPEEVSARQQEDELFAKMAAPPLKDGVASLLEEQAATDMDVELVDAADVKEPNKKAKTK